MREARWKEAFDTLVKPGPKLVDVYVLSVNDVFDLMAPAMSGNIKAETMIHATMQVDARLADRRQPPMQCVSCDREIKRGENSGPAVLQVRHGRAPVGLNHILGSATCGACGDLDQRELRRRVVRRIDVLRPGGRPLRPEHIMNMNDGADNPA
jgi:hypothetical protein